MDHLSGMARELRFLVLHGCLHPSVDLCRSRPIAPILWVRGASVNLRRDADECMVRALGRTLNSLVQCRDPEASGRALASAFRDRNVYVRMTRSRPSVVGWMSALRFVSVVCACCRAGGIVAGSAALFLELVCRGDAPDWKPGDVDCWVDCRKTASRVLDRLTRVSGDKTMVVQRSGRRFSVNYDGSLWACGPMGIGDPEAPGASVMGEVDVLGTRVQVIAQNSGVAAHDLEHSSAVVDCLCHQRPATMCQECGKRRSQPGFDVDDTYFTSWPLGQPHARFDLDITCVAVRVANDHLAIDRRCGDPSGAVALRPQSLWLLGQDGPELRPPAEIERLAGRIGKYAARGFSRVVIPDVCTFCAPGHPDQQLVTPPDLLRRLVANNSAQ